MLAGTAYIIHHIKQGVMNIVCRLELDQNANSPKGSLNSKCSFIFWTEEKAIQNKTRLGNSNETDSQRNTEGFTAMREDATRKETLT